MTREELKLILAQTYDALTAAALDSVRLNAVLDHAFEVVCKIPGGIQCINNRRDIDRVIAAYAAREIRTKR
jgi:hypothetical protein